MSVAVLTPTDRQIRERLDARADLARQMGLLDPAECFHPVTSLRFDGLWRVVPPMAVLTCMACGNSSLVGVRSDVAEHARQDVADVVHGGSRSPVTDASAVSGEAQGTTPVPADSTNPRAHSWRS